MSDAGHDIFLKWCPMCGGDAATGATEDTNSVTGKPNGNWHAFAYCRACDVKTQDYGGGSEQEARERAGKAWNREPESHRMRRQCEQRKE